MKTDKWIQVISESIINGQKEQAESQFQNAIFDSCNTYVLLFGIAENTTIEQAFLLAARIINKSQKERN